MTVAWAWRNETFKRRAAAADPLGLTPQILWGLRLRFTLSPAARLVRHLQVHTLTLQNIEQLLQIGRQRRLEAKLLV
jgi:hypothetical protein